MSENAPDKTPESTPDRARDIFLDLVTLAPDLARAELDKRVGDDQRLRAFVEELLDAHASADNAGFMGGAVRESQPANISEKPGSVIGPYKLLQKIGTGGFGTVFMAEQTAPVRRRVALKIINPGMDTRLVVARFEAERQALALMNHPHIARVFDGGATDSGRPYFVMEYVVGDPITKFADAHRLGVRERLELFAQVCSAVQHAHTKGIIHRDIKPANVLVSMVDGRPFSRVIDFGIAKATAAQLTEKTLYTEHGQLIGTPAYMSPEQADGSPDIDTRTDVYALGVLLYELLTGQTPLDLNRLRSAARDEIIRLIREDEPPAPSVRLSRDLERLASTAACRSVEPARLSTLVRGELDWIVMKALDKDRARRYETANAFAADVQRHLAGEAVVAAPPSAGYKLRKFVRRNKGPVIAGSAVAAALLVGIAGTTIGLVMAQINADAALRNAGAALAAKEEAEWSAYTANLALAQQAIDAYNYPEARERLAECPEGKRGWEWEFLRLRAPEGVTVLAGHMREIISVEFNSDGTRIVTTCEGITARLWDGVTGVPIAGPLGDTASSARFSPDGSRIVTTCQDNTARLWDALTGEPLGILAGHTDHVWTAVFNQDDTRIATTSRDNTIRLWDADAEQTISVLEGPAVWVNSAAFSPDGTRLVMGFHDGTARLWNAMTGKLIAILKGHTGAVLGVAFSSDGLQIVTASTDNFVRLWDTSTGEAIAAVALQMPSHHIWSVDFSPDLSRLVATLSNRTARVLDALTGETVAEFGCRPGIGNAAFSPDGTRVASGSWDGTVYIWEAQTGKPIAVLERHADGIHSAAFSPDGMRIITGSYDKTVRLWDIGTPEGIASCLSPINLLGLLGMVDMNGVGRSQAQHLDIVRNDPSGIGSKSRSIVTPNSTRRIAADARNLRFFDASDSDPAKQRQLAVFRMDADITNLQMTGDGTRLIIHLADGSARVWDIREPEERRTDMLAEWAERVPAGEYLDGLWNDMLPANPADAAPTPRIATDKLLDAIIADKTLTPLRRLVAAEMLDERLDEMRWEAGRVFDALRDEHEARANELMKAPGANAEAIAASAKADLLAAAASARNTDVTANGGNAPDVPADGGNGADVPADGGNGADAPAEVRPLHPRVRERVIALAAEWEYEPREASADG